MQRPSNLCPGYTNVEAFGPDEDYESEEEIHYITLDLGDIEPQLVPSSTTYRLIESLFFFLPSFFDIPKFINLFIRSFEKNYIYIGIRFFNPILTVAWDGYERKANFAIRHGVVIHG